MAPDSTQCLMFLEHLQKLNNIYSKHSYAEKYACSSSIHELALPEFQRQ